MAFTFDPIFATDPNNAQNVAANAAITLFDPADAGKAPITITDVTGAALPNPITVNKNGFGPAFVATIDRVGWHGAGFTGYFTSYEGLKQVATDAAVAAEAAQSAAETAGADAAYEASSALAAAVADAETAQAAATAAAGLVDAPADTVMETLVSSPGSAVRGALNEAFASKGIESAKRALRPGPGNTVAIGDSLTAWDGDGNPLRQRDTWFQQLCARTNQRIRYGGVFATGSFKLSDIRTTHLPSVLALDPAPAACFIFGGTNTETAGVAAGFPVLIDIAQQLEAKGIAPVLVTLLPRSDANNTNHQNWNNGLRTLAAKRGWLLYDPAPALLTTAGAQNTTLYADSAPAIHPIRPAGHTAMAKRGLTDDLAAAFPKMRLTSKEAGSANNLLPFNTGLFLVDTDANGLADNWAAAGTNVTYSLVAPTTEEDVVGNWQRVVRATGGSTSTVMQRSASAGFVAGNRVALSGRFKAVVEGTGSTYTVQAQWTGASGSPHALEPIYTWEHNNDGTFYGEAIVPAGTTSINVQVALSVPTSGTPSLQVAEVTLVNLSTGSALLPV